MLIIGNFLIAIATVLDYLLVFYMWIIIARAVLSWVNPDPSNQIVQIIYSITEPVLYQIRSRFPVNYGGIDFSPIIIFLAIIFLQTFLVNSLFGLGRYLL
ncbi:MAG: YggT family protein [Desulfococcaceae bacterium]|jgi:YggT family protein|nr:YggT family protein [Desulfococcaceae bacterium]